MSMAPNAPKRLEGRKVAAVACFDSFGKLAMTLLLPAAGKEPKPHCICWSSTIAHCRDGNGWKSVGSTRGHHRKTLERPSQPLETSTPSSLASTVSAVVMPCCNSKPPGPVPNQATPDQCLSRHSFRFALEGMLDRSGADLLCLNSQQDLSIYQKGCPHWGSIVATPSSPACRSSGEPIPERTS